MRRLTALLVFVFAIAAPCAAQESTTGFAFAGAPRFLSGIGPKAKVIQPASVPALQRRVTLGEAEATIGEALDAITFQTGIAFVFSRDVIPVETPLRIEATDLSLAAMLTELLLNAKVDVAVVSKSQLALLRRNEPQEPGTILGTVTDTSSQQPIASAQVWIEGTRRSALTDSEGNYRITGVQLGTHKVIASLIGYRRASQEVQVADGATIRADFALVIAPTTLTELVVTATGEQRRLELGHVVGRIDADSIVKAAPVSSVSELLNGRVAGVQVRTYQGTVGGDVALQIRGPNTIQLSNEPIVIVDGIRHTSRAAARIALGNVNLVEPTSPLNDLNPNEIESIEIAKGPSAATLYGTDAANGVIVITTKRGGSGPAKWNAYVKGISLGVPDIRYSDTYWGWGWKTADGAPSLTASCNLDQAGRRQCMQDSVTVVTNPLNDPQLSVFSSNPHWQYGGNVSGGSDRIRYFIAGDLEQATGPLQMPAAMADSIDLIRKLATDQRSPNALSKVNLRSNLSAAFGNSLDIDLHAGYADRSSRTLGGSRFNPYLGAFMGSRPGEPYGDNGPDQYFSRTTTERVSRFFGSVAASWAPMHWLRLRALGGVDFASVTRSSLVRRGEVSGAFGMPTTGAVNDDRGRQLATSGELGATANLAWRAVTSRTSVGAQYVRTLDDMVGSYGTDLPPGMSTINAAASVQSRQSYRDQANLGGFAEQTFGLNQRLFVTGAFRMDGASTFGRNYAAAIYPKASASWLISEENVFPRLPMLEELRLRYAFGASGQQPLPEWARPGYTVRQAFHNGNETSVFTIQNLGNPELRPERVREHEFGFDIGGLSRRVEAGLTWYRRATVDQIVRLQLPPGLGMIQTNLGRTKGSGFEAQVSIRPLDTRSISWQAVFQHSFHTTTLEDLGGAVEQRTTVGGWVEGHPLGARFQRTYTYEDANEDGLISSNEVTFGDTLVFAGVGTPPRTQTLLNSLAFLDGRLRFSMLLERRSGFTQVNSTRREHCSASRCRERVDPGTPLAEQAEAYVRSSGADVFIEPGDFTRLRELAIAVDFPDAMLRMTRLNSATLSLQGRNLALWSDFTGPDPESAIPQGLQQVALGIPQGRSWGLRLDVGF